MLAAGSDHAPAALQAPPFGAARPARLDVEQGFSLLRRSPLAAVSGLAASVGTVVLGQRGDWRAGASLPFLRSRTRMLPRLAWQCPGAASSTHIPRHLMHRPPEANSDAP